MPWYHSFSDSSRKEAYLFAPSFKTSEKMLFFYLLSLAFFASVFKTSEKHIIFDLLSCFLSHKYPSCLYLIFTLFSLFISLYSFCSMYCRWGGQRPYKLELFDAGDVSYSSDFMANTRMSDISFSTINGALGTICNPRGPQGSFIEKRSDFVDVFLI